MTSIVGSVRFSWRQSRRSPSWWLTACLVALAAGLLVTATNVYEAVVIRPLLASDPGRLVGLGGLAYGKGMPDAVGWWSRTEGIKHLAHYDCGNAELRF